LGKTVDLKGGYNTNQSEIAIGSEGWLGRGFLEGTGQRRVCTRATLTLITFHTVGEEWGFIRIFVVITLFEAYFLELFIWPEDKKPKFSRVYGYCVAVFYLHTFFL
jgi:rod shape determining protein RodA